MIPDKTFDHRPINELLAIVKRDLKKFDAEGLIDTGSLVKTVMYCNDKLGLPIREIREAAIPVIDFKAELPMDFEKMFYMAGLNCTSSPTAHVRNPFDNNVDQDVIYKACLNRDQLGCVDNYQVIIERKGQQIPYSYQQWTPLSIGQQSFDFCHIDCPNKRKPGKYQVEIKDGNLITPFRSGMIYIMYVGMMMDLEGNITFPFHPMITPYYEASIKEKVISNAIFNTEGQNLGELYKLAQLDRVKAWLDAFNFTTEREYGEYLRHQHNKELGWYNQYFKYFQ